MPLVRIKSLPFAQEVDIPTVLSQLSRTLAEVSGISLQHVMATWDFLTPHHYAHNGKVVDCQPAKTHPILVHLVAPNFNTENDIADMLELIAESLSEQLPIDKSNIFINYSPAYSDGVFDEGHVVEWDM
ncbi:hypothetical protein [Photobacterium ganghwense]|uniref:4-oxalocrotonate tautomerase domain-containing protein n=1 Tax=Photobacterium ganghwense TaxID=320778 RepID=A0A0J1HG45_9GAMM|nr:hypothetical protein [Photobacterium ganghwense]KLV10611.1 hypothetical protein ABT57_08850 [Photobacterium ganghwense]MBV1842537.1 hypothetical protein [Photobacterium ganghwense]PSU09478.1 hypothetical protein C9I92_08035 [Photobacterium ganghwense]QSV16721.1 hypothetical protein FH974_17255 [Photobacterium ganghwense]